MATATKKGNFSDQVNELKERIDRTKRERETLQQTISTMEQDLLQTKDQIAAFENEQSKITCK